MQITRKYFEYNSNKIQIKFKYNSNIISNKNTENISNSTEYNIVI